MTDFDDERPPNAHEQVAILRRVAAYSALCDSVRKSSVWGLVFGGVMLAFWYFMIPNGMKYNWFGLVYLSLAILEVGSGLMKRFAPSAEGVLLDGFVLIAFGAWNILREALMWQGIMRGRVDVVFVVFGAYWIFQGAQHCRGYLNLRRQFANRPSRAHIRWYNGLLREVRFADPKEDPQSLALPTAPPLTAKLLGDIAFFAVVGGDPIITTRGAVEIAPVDADDDRGRPQAVLVIENGVFDPFPLSTSNWENYRRWKAEAATPRS